MKKKDVKKLWQGKYVSVRDYEVKEAIRKGGLEINHEGAVMQIFPDELMELAGSTNDIEERKKYYAEMQHILAKELPLYPLFPSPYHTVSSKKVMNAPNSIWGTSSPLDKVWIK